MLRYMSAQDKFVSRNDVALVEICTVALCFDLENGQDLYRSTYPKVLRKCQMSDWYFMV